MQKAKTRIEAIRYLENAKELLRNSPIEGDRYEDLKYVQEACGTAYLAILKAVDEYLNELPRSRAARYRKEIILNPDAEHRGILSIKRGVKQKELPQSVEGYRDMLKKYLTPNNGKLTKEFEKLYKELHIAGYYRGLIEDVNALKDIFKSARAFINKVRA